MIFDGEHLLETFWDLNLPERDLQHENYKKTKKKWNGTLQGKWTKRRFKDLATVQLRGVSSRYRPLQRAGFAVVERSKKQKHGIMKYRTSLRSPGRTFDEKVSNREGSLSCRPRWCWGLSRIIIIIVRYYHFIRTNRSTNAALTEMVHTHARSTSTCVILLIALAQTLLNLCFVAWNKPLSAHFKPLELSALGMGSSAFIAGKFSNCYNEGASVMTLTF